MRAVGLKAGVVAPGLAVSTVLVTLLIGPALPTQAQLTLFHGGLLILVVLLAGMGESWAVRVLFGARWLSDVETTSMAPVVAELCHHRLGPPVTDLYVARRPGAPAARAHGRRSVVMSAELARGVMTRQLPPREAVAVLAHAALVARAGLSRQDAAIAFWSTPWRALRTLTRPLGGPLGFAWTVRPVVVGFAIYQCVAEGPPIWGPVAGGVLALMLAMTYATPRCAMWWERKVVGTVDPQLVDLGLGPAMAAFLRRGPQPPAIIARLQMLQPAIVRAPRLRLVGS